MQVCLQVFSKSLTPCSKEKDPPLNQDWHSTCVHKAQTLSLSSQQCVIDYFKCNLCVTEYKGYTWRISSKQGIHRPKSNVHVPSFCTKSFNYPELLLFNLHMKPFTPCKYIFKRNCYFISNILMLFSWHWKYAFL